MKRSEKEFDMMKAARLADIILPYLKWDVDPNGLIYLDSEDTGEAIYMKINGVYLKYPTYMIHDPELEAPFDLYNHTKIVYFCLNYYNYTKGWPIDLIYLTNKKMDAIGRLEIKYQNGVKITSNAYYKDSLKYADFLLKLENAAPIHFNQLRELDLQ